MLVLRGIYGQTRSRVCLRIALSMIVIRCYALIKLLTTPRLIRNENGENKLGKIKTLFFGANLYLYCAHAVRSLFVRPYYCAQVGAKSSVPTIPNFAFEFYLVSFGW